MPDLTEDRALLEDVIANEPQHSATNAAAGRLLLDALTRLDSHNRVMTSLTRRIRAIEQQARPYQEDGELAAEEERWRTFQGPELFPEAMRGLRRRAEAAENELASLRNTNGTLNAYVDGLIAERDAARATVERLSAALDRIRVNAQDSYAIRVAADALKETP